MIFQPLTLDSLELISSFQDKGETPLSDFNFTNLWIWKSAREISFALYEGCLIIRTCYPNQEPYYFYPLGKGDRMKALATLLSQEPNLYLKSLHTKQVQEIQTYCPQRFEITPTREHFDYVYSIAELISLSGRKYHKKKNHLNKFLQTYPDFSFEEVTLHNKQEVLESYKKWHQANLNPDASLLAEKRGIEALLEDFEILSRGDLQGHFALKGGILRLRGEIIAFSFAEALDSQNVVVHIEKANTQYLGAYQAINQQFLKNVWSAYQWVNREEDLGIEGLRKAKLSYQPAFLLEKFQGRIR